MKSIIIRNRLNNMLLLKIKRTRSGDEIWSDPRLKNITIKIILEDNSQINHEL